MSASDIHLARGFTRLYSDTHRAISAEVINIIGPDVMILGGGLSNIDSLYQEVPRFWRPYIFRDGINTELKRNRYGDSSGVLGAARLWSELD